MTPRTSPQASRQNGIPAQLAFSRIGRTCVQVGFDEPDLSSDGGALLLREAARLLLHGLRETALKGTKSEGATFETTFHPIPVGMLRKSTHSNLY